jgi:hypothetical protein
MEINQQRTGSAINPWLVPYLKYHNFWIRAEVAQCICKKLKIESDKPGYYKGVKVWLPEIQWGPDCTPCCVRCGESKSVGDHGFDKDAQRLVVGVQANYYIITRRWKCHACKVNFWAWHTSCLRKLPCMKVCEFPALLTHRSAIDKEVLSLIRALCPEGTRCEHISNLLRELHLKEFDRLRLLDVHKELKKTLLNPQYDPTPFSLFCDQDGYAGKVPTRDYIPAVYKKSHHDVRPFLFCITSLWMLLTRLQRKWRSTMVRPYTT